MTTTVNFEIAKLLKEKGFVMSFPLYLYNENGEILDLKRSFDLTRQAFILDEKTTIAPTIVEVVMWLYEKHGIWISVVHYNDEELSQTLWENKIVHIADDYNDCSDYTFYHSPTEAYEAAVDYTLTNLI